MRINSGKIRRKIFRVFFPDNTCQYQGFIYNTRRTSNVKKKGYFYKKTPFKISAYHVQTFLKSYTTK